MFKIVSVVFITLSVMIIHGDRSLVQAEVFEGGINDISHEANPWRRFWGGQCDSDALLLYVATLCTLCTLCTLFLIGFLIGFLILHRVHRTS